MFGAFRSTKPCTCSASDFETWSTARTATGITGPGIRCAAAWASRMACDRRGTARSLLASEDALIWTMYFRFPCWATRSMPSSRSFAWRCTLHPAPRADGAHPYNVNPEHTAHARAILGQGPYLCPEQAVVLETDPAKARKIAKDFLATYLALPNYTNNFLRLGFDESDIKNGGSDRLIDSIIAWGDLNAIRNRIRAHHSAGADHVCVQVLSANPRSLPLAEWREIAPALLRG